MNRLAKWEEQCARSGGFAAFLAVGVLWALVCIGVMAVHTTMTARPIRAVDCVGWLVTGLGFAAVRYALTLRRMRRAS
jgi:hypothetical protein